MDLSFQPLWVNADGGDCWAVRWVLRFRPLSPLQDSGKPTPAHTPLGQNHLRTAPMTFIVPGLHPPQSFRIKNKKKEKERKRKNKFRTAFLKSAFCRCEPAPAPRWCGGFASSWRRAGGRLCVWPSAPCAGGARRSCLEMAALIWREAGGAPWGAGGRETIWLSTSPPSLESKASISSQIISSCHMCQAVNSSPGPK